MSDVRKIELTRCMDVCKAISVLDGNDTLSPKTMYKLGRLSDHVKSPIKIYEKISSKKKIEVNDKLKPIFDRMKKEGDFEKKLSQEEITLINNRFIEESNDLLETEEEVKIPELKLSEFVASEDNTTKNIKKGQSLVPQQFFTLMGDLIIED